MKLLAKILILAAIVASAAYWYLTRPPLGQVLVFSKTNEYRHESIEAGIAALTEIAGDHRIAVFATEDPAEFEQETLDQYDAIVFLNTTGMVLDPAQQEAMERYIQSGGGFVGIHSAADTHWKENDWPWYTRLVGAAFLSHPSDPSNVQAGEISKVDQQSSLVAMFPERFSFSDEWYDYQRISPRIKVLLNIDESTYQGGAMGESHPVAWYQDYDGGRSFYTNFGHRPESFSDEQVRDHLWAGLQYAMGDGERDYSRAKPESWRLKRTILDAGLDEPMAMDFTPDGEIYFIQRRGALLHYDPALQESVEVTTFDVTTTGEYGLLGIAFDPDYANNHWLYIFRTRSEGSAAAYQLSRFQLRDGQLDHDSEQVILKFPTEAGEQSHTGGTLVFGPQGDLWISTGDTTNPHESDGFSPHDDRPGREVFDAARSAGNTMDLRGKILRITIDQDGDYSVPPGNLFEQAARGRPEIYAMGLRNPFRFSVDQRTGTLYWGEVGPDSKEYSKSRGPWGYDEFNRTDQPGNFGWPFVIGDNEPYAYFDFEEEKAGDFFDPAAPENTSTNNTGANILPPSRAAWMPYAYTLSDRFFELGQDGRTAMAGPVYYHDDYPENPLKLPPYYDGKLFIYEWIRHWVQAVQMEADGSIVKIEPILGMGDYSAPIDLKFAPDGSLYLLEYGTTWFAPNDDAYLTRVEFYGGDNPPPVAIATADKTAGAAPLSTTLRGAQSYDQNERSETLTFSWDIVKNGQVVQHIADTPDAEFVSDQIGEHQLRLTVTDSEGMSGESGVLLEVGNEPPEIAVSFSSGNASIFWDKASVDYAVTVTDAEDGSTADGSIDSGSVRITVQYVPEGFDLARAQIGHQKNAPPDGWAEIQASDCLSCHDKERESVGPSFKAISARFKEQPDAAEALARSILQGSQGKWGKYSMPAHSGFSTEQVDAIARWILDPAAQVKFAGGLPLAGTISFDRHEKDYLDMDMVGRLYTGRYLLLVSYTDRGADAVTTKTANYTKVWLPPTVDATMASNSQSTMIMPVPMEDMRGVSVAIFRSSKKERAWLMLEDFDLTGINAIRVGLTTSKLFTQGGTLSVRRNSPDGELIGTHTIENINLGLPTSLEYYDYDVSSVAGQSDLYLTTEETEREQAKPDYIMGTIEFVR